MRRIAWLPAVLLLSACDCGKPNGNGGGGGGATGGGAQGGGGGNAGGGSANGGGAGGGSGGCIAGATALTVTPASSTTQSTQPVKLTATATVNGMMVDVSSQVQWTATRADDTPPGTVDASGNFTPAAGGTVTVTATDGCLTGSATVTVQGVTFTFNDPGMTQTARFNGTVVNNDATHGPFIVYPNDETRFPRNIYKVKFQWRKAGNDFFRLTFTGPFSTTVVYSAGVDAECAAATPPAGCFESDDQVWNAIAGSNAGQTVQVVVDGVTMGDANVYRSSPITIGFSKRDVKGAIFYWSTTAAGVRRATVSNNLPDGYVVAKPVPTVLPAPGGTVQCVACHTVSRSGKRMAAMTQSNPGGNGEYIYEVTPASPPNVLVTTQISTTKGFATFSPDDQFVVSTEGNKLGQFVADTGVKVTDLPGIAAGTNPDWSPDYSGVAFSNKAGDSPGGASLQLIPYDDGGWGMVRTLVQSAAMDTNLFPSFSPDGKAIAYGHGKGGHGDKTMQLYLINSDGTGKVELVNANRRVNQQLTTGQFENNQPTWAPQGDLDWVAFNTARPYGVVVPNGGVQQIWVAAIDRSKDGGAPDGGYDPSYPAFRFAFQDLTENNHRAFWVLDVRVDYPDAGLDAGIPDAGPCVMAGDSCSQTAGAECCQPAVCDFGLPDGGMGDGGTYCREVIIQ